MRHEQPRGPTVFRSQRFARPVQRNEILRPLEVGKRQIGRESLLGDDKAVLRFLLHGCTLEQVLDRHSLERVIESAPRGDAMDVALHRRTRESQKLVPGQRERALHHAGDAKRPFRRVHGGHVAVMEDRPFGGLNLSWWDSRISHAQAWARFNAALKRSESLGPFSRMGLAPNARSNPFTTAPTLFSHNSSPFPRPPSRSTDVITTPGIPHGTIRSKCVRSVVTLRANPCQVTHCFT